MSEQYIGYLLKSIADKMKISADSGLKGHNLTLTQGRVLGYLNHMGGQATQKEVETFLHVSHPTVVGIINRMEQNGFVQCWLDKADKRNKIVCLTEHAKAIGKDIDKCIAAHEEQMLKGLSNDDIANLGAMLKVIYKNLE